MKPTIILMLLVSFYQNYAQSSHTVNVKIDQEESCEALSIESNESTTLQIYPNPVKTHLNIKSSNIIKEIIVYNLIGQEVMKRRVVNDVTTVDVRNIQSGIYTLQIKTDIEVYNHKIIIRHD